MSSTRISRRGNAAHRYYSVVVFVVLASLDNVAIGLVPPLYGPISEAFDVPQRMLGLVTAVSFLVSAVAAVGWAYVGDRSNRKPLLMVGTLVWAAGTGGSALAGQYPTFLAAQLVAAVGLGAVGSVGFSVVTDLISPRRRGLVMSFWGLSQGVGTLAGTLTGGLLGATDWRRPFLLLTVVGLAATAAYLFTYDIRRGQSEPELAEALDAGGEYDYRISRADLPRILARRTNRWLILQGLTAQAAFGSLVWLPVLFSQRAEAQGYSPATAVVVGSVFATLFQLGGALSIVGGLVGDALQRRTPSGRALVAAVGILAAVPFYLVLFFVPIEIDVPDGGGSGAVVAAVLSSVLTEPTVGLSLLTAVVALALTSANSPNWFALIADVNPPEHRGTVYSLGNLVNGVGRAAGNGVVGLVFGGLRLVFPPPLNYAVGLAAFQLFFIPTGIMYWLAARTSPRDIAQVNALLHTRADRLEGRAPS
ncbi:Predicted arabinose efflux permease, MFS family [Micromonospora sediminicola]|uniref:Predicted arabinose efflux permease, MFS family n=1 Tax=Micromonospora sediminicola TaxID=946078 RepID=A0A1A9B772_9ACTN|nr:MULTISPECIES: MFS transporter [Micromonospora]PGH42453.1 MFS transporter [Micromonospora sp. WMMA1996]SBT64747.1 Predicted arabinose efflux permease, MFS family [Micromonospora sediminicola]